MSLPAGSLIIYNVPHLAASPNTPYRIELIRSVCVISHQSQLGPHQNAACFCIMYMPNAVPTWSVVENSNGEFLMHLCLSRKQFTISYVKSFRATCYIPDSKRTRKQHVLTKEKLNETGDWLETFPREEKFQLAQQTGVSGSSARKAITELLRWHAIRQLRFIRQIWILTNDFAWGRKLKDEVCSNNPRTDGLKIQSGWTCDSLSSTYDTSTSNEQYVC